MLGGRADLCWVGAQVYARWEGGSMLGGRAGLCWVGGQVYAGWEGGSMLGGSCPILFFTRTNFFADSFLLHFAELEWAHACVRACACVF